MAARHSCLVIVMAVNESYPRSRSVVSYKHYSYARGLPQMQL